VSRFNDARIAFKPFIQDELIVIAPPDHPLDRSGLRDPS
jgi:hypothetical protein